jgi:hypothetical protein
VDYWWVTADRKIIRLLPLFEFRLTHPTGWGAFNIVNVNLPTIAIRVSSFLLPPLDKGRVRVGSD